MEKIQRTFMASKRCRQFSEKISLCDESSAYVWLHVHVLMCCIKVLIRLRARWSRFYRALRSLTIILLRLRLLSVEDSHEKAADWQKMAFFFVKLHAPKDNNILSSGGRKPDLLAAGAHALSRCPPYESAYVTE